MNLADLIQIFSLGLEIFGISFTLIEAFSQRKTTQFELKFSKVADKVNELWYKHNKMMACILVVTYLTCFGLWLYSDFDKEAHQKFLTFFSFNTIFFVSLMWIVLVFATLRRLFPTRQLFAFGITLSSLGLVGEIYQVTQIVMD